MAVSPPPAKPCARADHRPDLSPQPTLKTAPTIGRVGWIADLPESHGERQGRAPFADIASVKSQPLDWHAEACGGIVILIEKIRAVPRAARKTAGVGGRGRCPQRIRVRATGTAGQGGRASMHRRELLKAAGAGVAALAAPRIGHGSGG